MAKVVTVDANKLAKTVRMEIEVTGRSEFKLRSRVGGYFVRFGLWIIGVNVELKFKE